jgi:hypothetical protein
MRYERNGGVNCEHPLWRMKYLNPRTSCLSVGSLKKQSTPATSSGCTSLLRPTFVTRMTRPVGSAVLKDAAINILAVRATYPDLHLAIDGQIAEGNLVATQVTMTVVLRGEMSFVGPRSLLAHDMDPDGMSRLFRGGRNSAREFTLA